MAGQFVELRIDSPRFSVYENVVEKCCCKNCHGEASKPILGHQHPASLVPLPKQNVASRGWGEDFWVQLTERDGSLLQGVVDNPLYEARLHELRQGDMVFFHDARIVAVHDIHRQELLMEMDKADLKVLAEWMGSQGGQRHARLRRACLISTYRFLASITLTSVAVGVT